MEHETGTHTAGPWTVDAWGDMLAALKGVAAAHAGIESCDMPEWLDAVESAIAKAERSQGAEHED